MLNERATLLSFDDFVELLSPIGPQLSEIFGGKIPWGALWWTEEFRAGAPYWNADLEEFCGGPESLVEWMERSADGKPPIPKWILNATAPDFHAELQRFRLDIDKHRLAQAEHDRKRLDVYRFLAGHVVRSPGPWRTRRWQALRRLVPHDPEVRCSRSGSRAWWPSDGRRNSSVEPAARWGQLGG